MSCILGLDHGGGESEVFQFFMKSGLDFCQRNFARQVKLELLIKRKNNCSMPSRIMLPALGGILSNKK